VSEISKFFKLSVNEKLLFFEAVFFLFFSKVFLYLPFRFCIKGFKPAESLNQSADLQQLKKIHDAVVRANKLSFWKNICIVKSFAGRFMLQRRNIGSVMYLGLQFKNGKQLIAHAWLVSNGYFVTARGRLKFKEIFSV
jgi:hypothetical protein